MLVYVSPNAFRATAAKAGTATAATRPLTLLGTNIVRYTLNDEQTAEYIALTDDDARREFLSHVERKNEMTNGKVIVSKSALDDFTDRIKALHPATPVLKDGKPTGRITWQDARNAVLATYASGIVALNQIAEDRTESAVASLFPDEDAPAPTK